MMTNTVIKNLYQTFAVLLEYPAAETIQQAGASADALYHISPEAVEALKMFQQGFQTNSLATMREIYTVTFDMQPFCYPYIGYCLFGESYKRGAFMAQLNEAYRKFNFSAGHELPDHLPVVLRFLSLHAVNIEDEFCQVLISEGILPALEKSLKSFAPQSNNPYFGVLSALHQFVLAQQQKELNYA